MKFYHATHKDNLGAILTTGLKPGIDGYTYLCKDPVDAAKFVFIRGIRDIVVFEVDLDEDEVEETFDHSEGFFKCKADGTNKHINANRIRNVYDYSIAD